MEKHGATISPVYAHGAKHLMTKVRQQIVDRINRTPHTTIVDPFVGSGTFVAMDRLAKEATINFGPDCECDHDTVCDYIMHNPENGVESISVRHEGFYEFLSQFCHDDKESLLLIDPPRPSSEQYSVAFNQLDADMLLSEAISWRGPVVMTYYLGDMPMLDGGGWKTGYLLFDGPFYNLCDPWKNTLRPMVSVRSAR